jgi:LytS/YehU family sensor histidine kinase
MSKLEQFIDYIFERKRWIAHLLFWTAVLLLYAIFFGRKNNNYLQTTFLVGLLMPVTIGTTYFLNYYLVPRYLLKDHYKLFALYFTYTLIASLFLEMTIVVLTFIVMAQARIKDMSPASIDIFFLLAALLMVVFLAAAIKMVLHWRHSKNAYQKLMHDKVEAELKFLKTQLNPHFLFNTLNNLYYLTTQKSERAPQAVLALSEILDYVLHSGKTLFVPLQNELKQVENYIALEMLRYDDRVTVTTKWEGALSHHRIAPMVIITLIENAFKHGAMTALEKSWIEINLKADDEALHITVRNSYQGSQSGNGIGLANLKNQLEHLYHQNHVLETGTHENAFYVNLKLIRK